MTLFGLGHKILLEILNPLRQVPLAGGAHEFLLLDREQGAAEGIDALDHFQVTEEDTKRNAMYKAEKSRKEEQVKFASLTDFLQSLEVRVNIRPLEEKDLERAVQLTLRTNQFNLNGIRKSPEEIAKAIRQPNTINWIIEVKDRFGDYGIAGVLLAKQPTAPEG